MTQMRRKTSAQHIEGKQKKNIFLFLSLKETNDFQNLAHGLLGENIKEYL
jgi:hypothetical protein